MSVKTSQYAPSGQDVTRGPSLALWKDCPIPDFQGDPSLGMLFFDDFQPAGNLATTNAIGNMGQWATWADTSTVLLAVAEEGGVVRLSDGTNITKNITLGSTAGAIRLVSGATGYPYGQKCWFEARVAVGSITTACRDAFVGLVDNTTSFSTASAVGVIATTTNTLATIGNMIGFHFRSTTNPTDVGLAFNVAAGTVQYPTNLQTLANTVIGSPLAIYTAVANGAGTGFVKLGFLFDPTAGNSSKVISSASSGQTVGTVAKPVLQVFVNGQIAASFLTNTNLQAATFPTGWMAPTISYTSRSATVADGFYVDWIRCAQVGSF